MEKHLVVISDTHTGSSTALFPIEGYQGEGIEANLYLPNQRQKEIYPVFERLYQEVSTARIGKELVVVMLGDAVDGFHHGSMQETLFTAKDQCAAHKQLMSRFLREVGFNHMWGDRLYYVRGTESHVGQTEQDIARELGAEISPTGLYVYEYLELPINGKLHYFVHHMVGRGKGDKEGNALRNALRDFTSDREKDGLAPFDFLWGGHTHGHTWATWEQRIKGGNFRQVNGIICPSFQAKTTYAHGKVPMAVNSVGGTHVSIDWSGRMIGGPKFVVKVTE